MHGDEAAMDALVRAGAGARDSRLGVGTSGEPVRVVLVPAAVARHRLEMGAG